MKWEYTCIVCPNGCELRAEKLPGQEGYAVEGNRCPRGRDYILQEITDPRRTISTSMRVLGGERELASVRLTAPIPLRCLSEAVELIHKKELRAPVEAGEVVLPKILGYDSDVIVTRSVREREGKEG